MWRKFWLLIISSNCTDIFVVVLLLIISVANDFMRIIFLSLCLMLYHCMSSSPRQHQSYDVCYDGRLSELFCVVLCMIVVHSDAHTCCSSYSWVDCLFSIALHPWPFVSDIAIFVLERDIKHQLTHCLFNLCFHFSLIVQPGFSICVYFFHWSVSGERMAEVDISG